METPEQELEALKSWWQENGRSIVVGLVLGVGGVLGWTSWQKHVQSKAEDASVMYQQITDDAEQDKHDAVRARAATLVETYPDSGYAALAALLAARSAVAAGNVADAQARLGWVIANAGETSFRDVARLRLARLLAAENALDRALTTLDAVESEAFAGSAKEIRGDVLLAKGDADAARQAYLEALAGDGLTGPARSRVQMKIDDLGGSRAGHASG